MKEINSHWISTAFYTAFKIMTYKSSLCFAYESFQVPFIIMQVQNQQHPQRIKCHNTAPEFSVSNWQNKYLLTMCDKCSAQRQKTTLCWKWKLDCCILTLLLASNFCSNPSTRIDSIVLFASWISSFFNVVFIWDSSSFSMAFCSSPVIQSTLYPQMF